MENISILRATPGDLQEILELQYLAYRSEARLVGSDDIPPLRQTLAELEREHREGFLLKAVNPEGRIIGSVRGRPDGDTLHIGKLMVHPDFRGRGLGTALLREIERVTPLHHYALFTSTVSVDNIRLYEREGYVQVRREQVTPELTFVYMEK